MSESKAERQPSPHTPTASTQLNIHHSLNAQQTDAAATMQQRSEEQMQQLRLEMRAMMMEFMSSLPSSAAHPSSSPLSMSTGSASVTDRDSASRALPIAPQVPSMNTSRRQSVGVPYAATMASPLPATPISERRSGQRVSFGGQEGEDEHGEQGQQDEVEHSSHQATGGRDRQWHATSSQMAKVVKVFTGNSNEDKQSVIDWVEKVDTQFSIYMKDRQEGRLDLMRQRLEGSALRWMNRKVAELQEKQAAGTYLRVIEWETLRQPFIDAHLGLNTIETFKAQLRSLRLGSEDCPTPVELNKAYDHYAQLAFPNRHAEGMAEVMGDEYRGIIAASCSESSAYQYLYRNIERSAAPQTLDEWKAAVARFWSAEQRIKASESQRPSNGQSRGQRGRGGWNGRGGAVMAGRGRGGHTSSPSSTSLNAMQWPGENGNGEGQEHATEGEFNPELLNGMSQLGGQRGGRGDRLGVGRGGRYGGNGRAAGAMSEERARLYSERRCFRCQQVGHTQAVCPTPPTPRGAAGQSSQLNA